MLVFAEGNGFGHVARLKPICRNFGLPIMTFGPGAKYCREQGLDLIELPSPYVIHTTKDRIKLATNAGELLHFLKPNVLSTIRSYFSQVDIVIVDGSLLGLAVAMLLGKKVLFITNDTSSLVGLKGTVEKKLARSLLKSLLSYPSKILVPDFPPPLTISLLNLDFSLPLSFAGPSFENSAQKKHSKLYVVAGHIEQQVRKYLGKQAVYGSQVGELEPFIANCKLVICHGGHTTIMKALSFGKPVLCIVDSHYTERYNNALVAERQGVGVLLDKRLLSSKSLMCSIECALSLPNRKLSLYKKFAKESSFAVEFQKELESLGHFKNSPCLREDF
ncbi:MAG: glycosyltransferase [Candidatus Anstonellaceae archaeon]